MDEYIEEWPDDPVTGEPNTGNIRAAMDLAYRSEESLDALMALHGLPAGTPDNDGTVYSLVHERGGLLGAILHPASSRNVAPTEPVEVAPVIEESGDPDGAQPTPFPALTVLALLGAAAFLARRR